MAHRNQFSDVDRTPYNGWSNRSTWLLRLWLDSSEPQRRRYEQDVAALANLTRLLPLDDPRDFDWEIDEWTKSQRDGIYREVWHAYAKGDVCVWSHINWDELRRHFADDVCYALAHLS